MSDIINLKGLVATEPRHLVTAEGLPITSFRLATSDKSSVGTNWYTIVSTGPLAVNAAASIHKGERVLLTGKLRLREWRNSDQAGLTVEVDVTAIGHDLSQGTTTLQRTLGVPVDAYAD